MRKALFGIERKEKKYKLLHLAHHTYYCRYACTMTNRLMPWCFYMLPLLKWTMQKHGCAKKNNQFSYLVKITAHGPDPLRKNGFFFYSIVCFTTLQIKHDCKAFNENCESLSFQICFELISFGYKNSDMNPSG